MVVKKNLYAKRKSGRKMDEVREMSAKVGIVPSADGSASFQTGKTKALGKKIAHGLHGFTQIFLGGWM